MAVEIAEPLARRGLEDSPERAEPGPARELVEVGAAGPEIDLHRGDVGARRARTGRDRGARDGCRAARTRVEVALRDQLVIRLDDDAARHAELRRERTRRGESRPGGQAAAADSLAKALLELIDGGASGPRRSSGTWSSSDELVLSFGIELDLIRGPVEAHDRLATKQHRRSKTAMELLIFIILVIGAVVVFDLLAAAFGVDSRPAMNDDRATMWRI